MPEDSPHCYHFVKRKKRFCRMTVKPGDKFCGEHQPAPETGAPEHDGAKIRISCPLDPKHTCFAHNLRKHLKVCNARPKDLPAYIVKGINSDSGSSDSEAHKLLSTFPTSEIAQVVQKINKIYDEHVVDTVTEKLCAHHVVEDEMAKPEHGDKSRKHLRQASAILGLLEVYELLKPDTCFVEFGAGRGQLSYWLAQAVENTKNPLFVLVERASPKHKRDNKLDGPGDKVRRIRADIADLALDKVESTSECGSIVGVTKHLCGDATDLALRCLAQCRSKVGGCIMTFCCHHRCRWASYTGRDFLTEIGLTKNDFDMICGMTSWATCGTGFSRQKIAAEEMQNERDKEIGLGREDKKEVGKKCKAVLNWGRLRYCESLGFKSALHYYVGADVSLENVCIVATRDEINE